MGWGPQNQDGGDPNNGEKHPKNGIGDPENGEKHPKNRLGTPKLGRKPPKMEWRTLKMGWWTLKKKESSKFGVKMDKF